MKDKSANAPAEIRALADDELEMIAGAWHKEIKLANLGMTIMANDGGYGVSTTDGNRRVTSFYRT